MTDKLSEWKADAERRNLAFIRYDGKDLVIRALDLFEVLEQRVEKYEQSITDAILVLGGFDPASIAKEIRSVADKAIIDAQEQEALAEEESMTDKISDRIPCSMGCEGAYHARGETPFGDCNRTKVAALEQKVERYERFEQELRRIKGLLGWTSEELDEYIQLLMEE